MNGRAGRLTAIALSAQHAEAWTLNRPRSGIGRKRRLGHSVHLIRGFSQSPRTHSLAQAGA